MWQKRLCWKQPSTHPWNNGTIPGRAYNHWDYVVWLTLSQSQGFEHKRSMLCSSIKPAIHPKEVFELWVHTVDCYVGANIKSLRSLSMAVNQYTAYFVAIHKRNMKEKSSMKMYEPHLSQILRGYIKTLCNKSHQTAGSAKCTKCIKK